MYKKRLTELSGPCSLSLIPLVMKVSAETAIFKHFLQWPKPKRKRIIQKPLLI